jgi:hypothetical protein
MQICPVIVPGLAARLVDTIPGSQAAQVSLHVLRSDFMKIAVIHEPFELTEGAPELYYCPFTYLPLQCASEFYACLREADFKVWLVKVLEKEIDAFGQLVAIPEPQKARLRLLNLFVRKIGDNRMELPAAVYKLDLFAAFPIERLLPCRELFPNSMPLQISPLDMPELVPVRFTKAPVFLLFMDQRKLRCTL